MFDIRVFPNDEYTLLLCHGPANLENLKNIVDKIADGEFGGQAVKKYLIDLRPIIGTISTFERYELGKYIAQSIPRLRIAAISKKESYDKVGENVAVNRGANIYATDDEADAVMWLREEGKSP